MEVFIKEGGFINRIVCHLGGLSSGWSIINGHHGGLSLGVPLYCKPYLSVAQTQMIFLCFVQIHSWCKNLPWMCCCALCQYVSIGSKYHKSSNNYSLNTKHAWQKKLLNIRTNHSQSPINNHMWMYLSALEPNLDIIKYHHWGYDKW